MNYKLAKKTIGDINLNGIHVFEAWNSSKHWSSNKINLFDETNSHLIYDQKVGFFKKLIHPRLGFESYIYIHKVIYLYKKSIVKNAGQCVLNAEF